MGQPISSDRRTKQPSWKRQSAEAGPFLEDHCGWLLAEHISSPLIFFHRLQLTTLTLAQEPLLSRMICHQSERCWMCFVGADGNLNVLKPGIQRTLLPPSPHTGLGRVRSRCCVWPGPLLTTVEPDTESHYPKKVNHGGKTLNECEIPKRREGHQQNIPEPRAGSDGEHNVSQSTLSWLI